MAAFEVEALQNHRDPGPVTMVNLVKFRAESLDGNGTGRDAYTRFANVLRHLFEERGVRVVWLGLVDHPVLQEGGEARWDLALLVHYPSRAVFLEMIATPQFIAANEQRCNGVERQVILATTTMISAPFPDL